MADDGKPTATVLRIKVRHADVETFVERFANQVTRAGVFIPTRTPKPIGTEVRFEIRLADDRPVLVGQGAVRLVRQHDATRPRVVAGMAVELQRVGRDSRDVLLKMLEVRKRRGFVDGPSGMPLPGDEPSEEPGATDTTAIRAVPRRPAAAPPVAEAGSEPGPAPGSEPGPASGSGPGSGSDSVARSEPGPDSVAGSEPGPDSAPESVSVAAAPAPPAALAPAAPRARAPLDLAAIAAAPPADDVLDDDLQSWTEAQVPLEAVVARARALAGGADLDSELAAIIATPLPVVDRDSARAAVDALVAGDRPRRARRERLAPFEQADALSAPIPRPITDAPAATTAPAAVDAPTPPAPTPPTPTPTPPAPTPPAAFEEPSTAVDHARLAAEEAERVAARARAAERATRERARREANDRALQERSDRVRRETAERDRLRRERAVSAPPAPPPRSLVDEDDPFAGLDLDLDDPPTRKPAPLAAPTPARKPPTAPRHPPEETTRKVDAAALAAEALDAGALRASLTDGPDPDLSFLDGLSLEKPRRGARPAPARPHTVPRATTARPAAVIPPAPGSPGARNRPGPTRPAPAVPAPSEAVDLDLDDDHEIEIQIDHDGT